MHDTSFSPPKTTTWRAVCRSTVAKPRLAADRPLSPPLRGHRCAARGDAGLSRRGVRTGRATGARRHSAAFACCRSPALLPTSTSPITSSSGEGNSQQRTPSNRLRHPRHLKSYAARQRTDTVRHLESAGLRMRSCQIPPSLPPPCGSSRRWRGPGYRRWSPGARPENRVAPR